MSHLVTYSGILTGDAQEKIVTLSDEAKSKRKVLTFSIVSASTIFKGKKKYFDVTFWFNEDQQIKQLPFLNKDKIVSFQGEETAQAYVGKNQQLKVNYKITGFRGSLQFLSFDGVEKPTIEVVEEAVVEPNYLDED